MKVYLRTIRERRRLTQVELAQRSGIAQNTISKLEGNPKSRPIFVTVTSLAAALQVEPTDLCFGPDPSRRRRRGQRPGAAEKEPAVPA